MLPIGMLGSLIYDFSKKHTKNETHIKRNFFLYSALFFLLFGFAVGGGMVLVDFLSQKLNPEAVPKFLLMIPGIMFVMGELHALAWWLSFMRKK